MAARAPAAAVTKQRRIVQRYREDPVFFATEVLGVELWSKQREILASVRDNRSTAVRACHGPGKTFTAAIAALWFLRLPEARVVTTAPAWAQVKTLLWHEINQLHARARQPLGGTCNQTELHLGDGRYAVGLSTRPDRVESFQGHHAPNILLIYDEASGIPQPIFEAGDGYMTTPGARRLMIGNPTRPEGEFYAAFHKARASYNQITISAFDLPWATGEKVSDRLAARLTSEQWVRERDHWQGTPLWDVKVLGQFPAGTEDAVVALHEVEDAHERQLDPDDDDPIIAVDVARFGSDETVIVTRRGPRLRIARAYVGRDLMETVGHVLDVKRELGGSARIVVDDTGVGGGVTDRLREQGERVTPFNGGERAYDDDAYPNRRSEVWFDFAGELPELDLDDDDQLAADLTAPRWKMDSKGRRVVEPKDVTKKRIGRSPDRADAALLTMAASAAADEVILNVF